MCSCIAGNGYCRGSSLLANFTWVIISAHFEIGLDFKSFMVCFQKVVSEESKPLLRFEATLLYHSYMLFALCTIHWDFCGHRFTFARDLLITLQLHCQVAGLLDTCKKQSSRSVVDSITAGNVLKEISVLCRRSNYGLIGLFIWKG